MRILIVDDHRIFAESLGSLLSTIAPYEVIGIVNTGQQALELLKTHPIDLVISDLQMPQMNGIELTLRIRQLFPPIKVMMLSMVEDRQLIREAIRAGVMGFGSKNMDKVELQKALKLVAEGEIYLSPSVVQELTFMPATPNKDEANEVLATLSDREIEVLRLIAQEMNTNQIAEKLFVSINTIETHRKNLMKKVGAKNSIGLIKFALRHHLID